MIPPVRSLVAVVLGAAVLASCGFPADEAAIVDGTHISESALHERIPVVQMLQELQGGICGMTQEGEAPAAGDEDAACARQTLGLMIQGQILRNLARERDLELTESDYEDFRAGVIEGAGGQEAFDETLKELGVTQEDVDGLLGDLGIYSVLQGDFLQQEVGEEDLRQIYEENKAQFVTIDSAHILTETEEEAQDIFDRVTTENFAEIAAEESIDPSSAENGGELGQATAAELVEEYSNAALNAEPDQIVGPVESPFGWHVIWVHSTEEIPFEQARTQLLEDDQAGQIAFQEFLTAEFEAAEVEVNPRYGRWVVREGIPDVVPIESTATEETTSEAPAPVDEPAEAPAAP